MQTNIYKKSIGKKKVNWKVSRHGIAEMKGPVILLTELIFLP